MNNFFSTINSLQITAHMPLLHIPFSPISYFLFDILIQFVAFDFASVTNKVDFGFQRTEPWDHSFEWLGYESTNFIEILGAIQIIILMLIIQGIVLVLFHVGFSCCRSKLKRKVETYLGFDTYSGTIVRFFLETFFELIICVSVSFKMLEIRQIWGRPEYVTVIFQAITIISLVIFILFVLKFICQVQPRIVEESRRLMVIERDVQQRAQLEIQENQNFIHDKKIIVDNQR